MSEKNVGESFTAGARKPGPSRSSSRVISTSYDLTNEYEAIEDGGYVRPLRNLSLSSNDTADPVVRRFSRSPSIGEPTLDATFSAEAFEEFQRVKIEGQDLGEVWRSKEATLLVEAIKLRMRYMEVSKQRVPSIVKRCFGIGETHVCDTTKTDPLVQGDPWECNFPPDAGYSIKLVNGVMEVYQKSNRPRFFNIRRQLRTSYSCD